MKSKHPTGQKPKAVLFDMDGVLVDSMPYHRDAWKELLLSFEVTVTDRFIFENEGAMAPEILVRLFQSQGKPIHPDLIQKIYLRQNETFLRDYLPLVGLYPETSSLLSSLKEKGVHLALVTGSRRNLVEKIWKPSALGLFSAIVSADDTERFKPHPDPYLKAVGDLGVRPDQCLAVENAPAGIRAAKAAGLTCFAVTSTLPEEKLALADKIFPDLSAIKTYLLQNLLK